MSFEGYYQCLCEDGHLTNRDAYDFYADEHPCSVCGKVIAYSNLVDQTNGEDHLTYQTLEILVPEKTQYCHECDSVHLVSHARYKIPGVDYSDFVPKEEPAALEPHVEFTQKLQALLKRCNGVLAVNEMGGVDFVVNGISYPIGKIGEK